MTNTTHTVALTGDGVLDALGIATAAISVIASLCIIGVLGSARTLVLPTDSLPCCVRYG